jgi:aminocarboxymuconate-semialdehyde decarboxylase
MCSHAFFGTGHLLFGTDVPYGPAAGEPFIRQTIDAIEGMKIPDADKQKIYEKNAKALLRLGD